MKFVTRRSSIVFTVLVLALVTAMACSGGNKADDAVQQDNRKVGNPGGASATPLPDTPGGHLAGTSLVAPTLVEEDGQVSRLSGRIRVSDADSSDPVEISRALIEDNPEAFGLEGGVEIANQSTYESSNRDVVTFTKTVNGVPVFGAAVRTHVSGSGEVLYAANTPAFDTDVADEPEISLERASEIALSSLTGSTEGEVTDTELMIFNEGILNDSATDSHLAYRIDIFSDEPAYLVTFIDAVSGELLFQYDDFQGALDAAIFDSKNSSTVQALKPPIGQADLLLTEDGRVQNSPAHAEGQLALNYLKKIYDYFEDRFGWQSYDGLDSKIDVYVDVTNKKNNAFWSRKYEMMAFHEGLVKLDVFAHEYTHAVTSSKSGLIYLNESGALNEAFSDIFSEFVEANGKWQVGEELSMPEVNLDGPLRNMINPPLKNHPWRYADRYTGAADKGGVHINSSIINHAAYVLVNGTHDPDGMKRTSFDYTANGKDGRRYDIKILQGIGQAKAEQILFDSQDYMIPSETFAQARRSVIFACEAIVLLDENGITTRDCGAVINAFAAVGLGQADRDFDTVLDRIDNCETDFNPLQEDEDSDGVGDACEGPELVVGDPTETPEPTATSSLPGQPDLVVFSVTSFEGENDRLHVMGEVINSGSEPATGIRISLLVTESGEERAIAKSSSIPAPSVIPVGEVYPFSFTVQDASTIEDFEVQASSFRMRFDVLTEGIQIIDDLMTLQPYSPTLELDNQQFRVTWFAESELDVALTSLPAVVTFYDESGAVVGVYSTKHSPYEVAPGVRVKGTGFAKTELVPDAPASYRITAVGELDASTGEAVFVTAVNDRIGIPDITVNVHTNTGYVGFGSGWLYGEVTNTGDLPTKGASIVITMSDGRRAGTVRLASFDGVLEPGDTVPFSGIYGVQQDEIESVDDVEWSASLWRDLPDLISPEVTVSGLSVEEIIDNIRVGNRREDVVRTEVTGTITNNTEFTLSVGLSGILRSRGDIVDVMSNLAGQDTTELGNLRPGESFNFRFQSRANVVGDDVVVRTRSQCRDCP